MSENKQLIKALTYLGLDDSESAIYTVLLENGALLPQYIARQTGIKRTTLYEIFPQLLEKGVIEEVQQGKRRLFQAVSPDKVLDEYEKKHKEIKQYLQEMAIVYRVQGLKPKIEIYEGVEGVKKVFLDTLETKSLIRSYNRVAQYEPQLLEWVNNIYVPKRVRAGLKVEAIVTANEFAKKHMPADKLELRETRFVPEDKFPFRVDGMIYDDKICFTATDRNGPLVGIIIESKKITQTHKALFDLAWEAAEKYNK